jgi:ABC-2 type transport system ATP-binding protein
VTHADLAISDVSKYFGHFRALNQVNFEIQEGSTVILIGPNGAGKTTLLRCILGLLNFRGRITLDGVDVKKHGERVRSMIGYVPQQSAYYENLAVMDESRLIAKLKKSPFSRIEPCLKEFNLWEQRKKQIRSLSSGMKQRLGVALALLSDPSFLIFDEPTSNLDLLNQLEFQAMLERLAKEGKTILVATHLSGLSKSADRAIVIDLGRVVADGVPKELLQRINTTDTVYVRTRSEDVERVQQLLQEDGVRNLSFKGGWISFLVSPERKAQSLSKLVGAGYSVEDVIIEQSSIESEYLKFLDRSPKV